jgi:hypothetical protein
MPSIPASTSTTDTEPLQNNQSCEPTEHSVFCVETEVLTAVIMKSSIFCDITPCSSLKQPTFRRNISSPYWRSKNRPSKKPAWNT